jgi:glucokinase
MREFLPRSAFRQRFVGKGRFERYLAAIPSWLIDTPVLPTLEGAALALEWEYAS